MGEPDGITAPKSGAAYVDPKNVLEGEVISREDINETAEAWEYAEERVSEVNIREEGLARANFNAAYSWADNQGSTSRATVNSKISLLSQPLEWSPLRFGSGPSSSPVSGGVDSQIPTIEFEWDPQHHTYAIIRCSMIFELDVGMQGDEGRHHEYSGGTGSSDNVPNFYSRNQHFQFGIKVWNVDLSMDYAMKTRTRAKGGILGVSQIGLNPDFSEYACLERGALTPNLPDQEGTFDLRSKLSSTVSMVVTGSSWGTEHSNKLAYNNSTIDLREKGTYRAQVVWRARSEMKQCLLRVGDDDAAAYGDQAESEHFGQMVQPEAGNLNLFAQIFRR